MGTRIPKKVKEFASRWLQALEKERKKLKNEKSEAERVKRSKLEAKEAEEKMLKIILRGGSRIIEARAENRPGCAVDEQKNFFIRNCRFGGNNEKKGRRNLKFDLPKSLNNKRNIYKVAPAES